MNDEKELSSIMNDENMSLCDNQSLCIPRPESYENNPSVFSVCSVGSIFIAKKKKGQAEKCANTWCFAKYLPLTSGYFLRQ